MCQDRNSLELGAGLNGGDFVKFPVYEVYVSYLAIGVASDFVLYNCVTWTPICPCFLPSLPVQQPQYKQCLDSSISFENRRQHSSIVEYQITAEQLQCRLRVR
jgi:hypothetical protein